MENPSGIVDANVDTRDEAAIEELLSLLYRLRRKAPSDISPRSRERVAETLRVLSSYFAVQ